MSERRKTGRKSPIKCVNAASILSCMSCMLSKRRWVRSVVATGVWSLAALRVEAAVLPKADPVPHVDHVVVVVMENERPEGVALAPYIAEVGKSGVVFSNARAVTHPSLPNYFALWSGTTQGVTSDQCPPLSSPFGTENLGHAC